MSDTARSPRRTSSQRSLWLSTATPSAPFNSAWVASPAGGVLLGRHGVPDCATVIPPLLHESAQGSGWRVTRSPCVPGHQHCDPLDGAVGLSGRRAELA